MVLRLQRRPHRKATRHPGSRRCLSPIG
jgi:hypothetical protein